MRDDGQDGSRADGSVGREREHDGEHTGDVRSIGAAGAEDVAWQRLKAADPHRAAELARSAELEGTADLDALARVRAATDERVRAQAAAEPGPARAGAHRWGSHRAVLLAACAAGVLVVGGAGYVAGAGRGGSFDASLADQAGTGSGAEQADAGLAGPGSADASEELPATGAADAASSWAWPATPERIVFTAGDLPTGPATAEAWGFDATSVATSAGASRVADALGVPGEPRYAWGAWTVGTDERQLSVQVDGQASAWYTDARVDLWACGDDAASSTGDGSAREDGSALEDGTALDDGSVLDDGSALADSPGIPVDGCDGAADAPDVADAEQQARDLLATLGVTAGLPAGATVAVEADAEAASPVVHVTATLELGGVATSTTWGVGVGPEGVTDFSGPLAPVVELGQRPVVSPVEAVARLGDPRFTPTLVDDPAVDGPPIGIMEDEPEQGEDAPVALPPAPTPGGDVAWPVEDVRITGATLGTVDVVDDAGTMTLEPAYLLAADDGRVWSVLAVAESVIDTTAGR
ncbi:hypothetical protein [Sediminihabitans luteus]|uniref:hypothetical protein n=1 Tax=Sediminihabitans luteus TaxID=1138585 RepID=UPI0012FE7CE2|nr:hypothetical protein [Sediminihabitans luteus]